MADPAGGVAPCKRIYQNPKFIEFLGFGIRNPAEKEETIQMESSTISIKMLRENARKRYN